MYSKEVEKTLKEHVPKEKQKTHFEPASYMGTGFFMFGLSSPLQRSLFKKGYSFSALPLEEQLDIWEEIWNGATIFELMTQALFFPEKYTPKFDTKTLFDRLKNWVDKVDNWGHSDMFSSIFARMLEREPEYIYRQLEKWNRSKNSWKRRQSVVPLAMYHKRKGKDIDFLQTIALIETLIPDDDYFVQKGIGWALRETGVRYPHETWNYVKSNCRQIAPAAFTATIEKLPPEKKEELKSIRKKLR